MSPAVPDSVVAERPDPPPVVRPISPLFPYLLGGLLHDVNNSLTALLLSAELGRSMSGAEIQELLRDVQFHARLQHVAQVVGLMQNLARDYYAPGPRSNLSVAQRVAELAARLRTASPGLAVNCACDARVEDSNLPEALVLFLAGELLQNAVRACEGGAGHRVDLTVAAEPEDNSVSFAVVDDGPGFPGEQLAAIRNGHVKPPAEGVKGGYGLYFVNEIALRLQGRLLASNREAGGARVEVLLPFHFPVRS
ncbi:MAG: sensor histidine kinase [Verrucomicrobiota bacterium]|jgi:signal transduction histidine kinase